VMTTVQRENELLWAASSPRKLKIGIVLSKGQPPGGHTVIHGPVGESKPYSTQPLIPYLSVKSQSISSLLAMLMVKHPCDMRWLRMLGLRFLVTRHLTTWPKGKLRW
ncbi:LOW QUALITY PROTEIN: hypothetical protein HID58_086383, partial [Brassica napus]